MIVLLTIEYSPSVSGLPNSTPIEPVWSTVPVQSHPLLALFAHVAVAKPTVEKRLESAAHVVLVPEKSRHAGAIVNCTPPVVVVLSENVPFEFRVNVPAT